MAQELEISIVNEFREIRIKKPSFTHSIQVNGAL